jgi:hypothetical protein
MSINEPRCDHKFENVWFATSEGDRVMLECIYCGCIIRYGNDKSRRY